MRCLLNNLGGEEEVFFEQPPGFTDPTHPDYDVYKLFKMKCLIEVFRPILLLVLSCGIGLLSGGDFGGTFQGMVR
jgi:hypothetical protein